MTRSGIKPQPAISLLAVLSDRGDSPARPAAPGLQYFVDSAKHGATPSPTFRMGWGQGVYRMLSHEAQHPAPAGRA